MPDKLLHTGQADLNIADDEVLGDEVLGNEVLGEEVLDDDDITYADLDDVLLGDDSDDNEGWGGGGSGQGWEDWGRWRNSELGEETATDGVVVGEGEKVSLTEEVVVLLVEGPRGEHQPPKRRHVPEGETAEDEDEDEVADDEEFAEIQDKNADEFVCTGCFLVKHKRQRAQQTPLLCNDCY